jgi:hypothetical protein
MKPKNTLGWVILGALCFIDFVVLAPYYLLRVYYFAFGRVDLRIRVWSINRQWQRNNQRERGN